MRREVFSIEREADRGINRHTWNYISKHGEMPAGKRGPKRNEALSSAILAQVKIAFAVGCSDQKVWEILRAHVLRHLWQQLRYAYFELRELDPDLTKVRANPLCVEGPCALIHIDVRR